MYKCADCGNRQLMQAKELGRRFRARCTRCGSLAIDPASDGAQADVLQRGSNRALGTDLSVPVVLDNMAHEAQIKQRAGDGQSIKD